MNKLMKLKRDKKGFTLIEIIIVIVIIAVLAAMIVPNMMSWIRESKQKTFLSEANSVKSAVSAELVNMYADNVNVADQSTDEWTWDNVKSKFDKPLNTDDITFTTGSGNKLTAFHYEDNQFQVDYDFTTGKFKPVKDKGAADNS